MVPEIETVQKINILLVGIQPANLRVLASLLDDLELNHVQAHSGEEALRCLLDNEFALILIDAQMANMDGFETAARIHASEQSRGTPIIFLIANDGNSESAGKGYAAGAVDCIVKPIVPEILRYKVKVFTDMFRQAQLLRQQSDLDHADSNVLWQERLDQAKEALRQKEEQFLQAQKMEAVGLMASGLIHDFNNVLTTIQGHAELLHLRLAESDPGGRSLVEILKASQRAASLTQQFLAFSRRQKAVVQPLCLNPLIMDVEKMLRGMVGAQINLKIFLDPDLAMVLADPPQLEQVLVNLVVNARDAMTRGGQMTIETANVKLDETCLRRADLKPGRYVLLAVDDTGAGMDARTRAQIFEPFFTTKEQGKGTGLGLSTVYGIVKQAGGHIAVCSELGHGTSFRVYLPRSGDATAPVAPAALAPIARGTETIVVVEDDAAVRGIIELILSDFGYQLLMAGDGQEALVLLAQQTCHIHLLLTDMVLPGMTGTELARQVAVAHPGIKILFTTGYSDDQSVMEALSAPHTAFLPKPFSPRLLAGKVREILDA